MILTAAPAAAVGTVATVTDAPSFELGAAVIVLAGISVLVGIAAHAVNIWKATRPVPPIGDQIQNAIDRHEKAASERNAEQARHLDDSFEQMGKDIGRVEKRLDGYDDQLRELWRAVPYTARQPG